jgi:hypothetical protein
MAGGRRASTPTRKGRSRDQDYKAWIRTLPCCACGIEGRSEAAHAGSDGGMSILTGRTPSGMETPRV